MRRCSLCQSRIPFGAECIKRGPRELLCLICSLGEEYAELPLLAALEIPEVRL